MVVQILSELFFLFLPTKFARTTNMKIACPLRGWGGKSPLLPVDKPSGWDTTLSKTHDMPKQSRAAREQPDRLFLILAEHTEFAEIMRILRSITTNIHNSSQALDHAKACSTVSGQPWKPVDAMVKTRWWSLFTLHLPPQRKAFAFKLHALKGICSPRPAVTWRVFNFVLHDNTKHNYLPTRSKAFAPTTKGVCLHNARHLPPNFTHSKVFVRQDPPWHGRFSTFYSMITPKIESSGFFLFPAQTIGPTSP